MNVEIPKGNSREDIKKRETIIKEFYREWWTKNPTHSVWNTSLQANIIVKHLSMNETYEHASRRYESTLAVLKLTKILENAHLISSGPKKQDDKNQKSFSKVMVMQYKKYRLIVGYQHSTSEYVQYSITSSNESSAKK